jgi:hypothetical protein
MLTYRDIKGIDKDDVCLSSLLWPSSGTRGIVRRTTDGQFALLEISGRYARIVKTFPTLERARSYNFACAK